MGQPPLGREFASDRPDCRTVRGNEGIGLRPVRLEPLPLLTRARPRQSCSDLPEVARVAERGRRGTRRPCRRRSDRSRLENTSATPVRRWVLPGYRDAPPCERLPPLDGFARSDRGEHAALPERLGIDVSGCPSRSPIRETDSIHWDGASSWTTACPASCMAIDSVLGFNFVYPFDFQAAVRSVSFPSPRC